MKKRLFECFATFDSENDLFSETFLDRVLLLFPYAFTYCLKEFEEIHQNLVEM